MPQVDRSTIIRHQWAVLTRAATTAATRHAGLIAKFVTAINRRGPDGGDGDHLEIRASLKRLRRDRGHYSPMGRNVHLNWRSKYEVAERNGAEKGERGSRARTNCARFVARLNRRAAALDRPNLRAATLTRPRRAKREFSVPCLHIARKQDCDRPELDRIIRWWRSA